MKPTVSVIIPAHNEEREIAGILDSLLAQSAKPFEVIVVNDGSIDDTRKTAEKYRAKCKYVKLLNYPTGHSAAFARNRGAEAAHGSVLLFMDADVTAAKNLVEETQKAFSNASVMVATYEVANSPPKTFVQRCYEARYRYLDGVRGKSSLLGIRGEGALPFPNIYRRRLFLKAGGYDERVFYYEDKLMYERVKRHGIARVHAFIYNSYPRTLGECLRQARYMGKGAATHSVVRSSPVAFFYPLSPFYWAAFSASILAAALFQPAAYAAAILLLILIYELARHVYYSHALLPSIGWVLFLSPLRALFTSYSYAKNKLGASK